MIRQALAAVDRIPTIVLLVAIAVAVLLLALSPADPGVR